MMNTISKHVDQIVTHLTDGLRDTDAMRKGLDQLLSVTHARATGWWSVIPAQSAVLSGWERNTQTATFDRANGSEDVAGEGVLKLLGFRGVADMSDDVKRGFMEATSIVPLSDTSLGIVKAVVACKPAVATLANANGSLAGSATWLQRFDAIHSLAVPIVDAEQIFGVLAISTAESLDDAVARPVMLGVAARLGSVGTVDLC